MHRTQIMLDNTQYIALRDAARRTGKSMGEIIRQFVEHGLRSHHTKRRSGSPLKALRGIVSSPSLASQDHDDVLYGEDA
jgi:hypothetical protein